MTGYEVLLVLLGAWGGVVIAFFGLALVKAGKRSDQSDCPYQYFPWQPQSPPASLAGTVIAAPSPGSRRSDGAASLSQIEPAVLPRNTVRWRGPDNRTVHGAAPMLSPDRCGND